MKSRYDYIYGSAAPKLPGQPQNEEHRIKKTPPLRKVAIKQEPVVYPLATMIICIIAGFAIMFTMVYRFATITELNCELAAMGQEYETLRDSNRKLQAEIAASINQANIRKIAEERLDMKMPDSYQRIPVKVPKVNYSMVVENKSEEQKTTLLSYLAALLQ